MISLPDELKQKVVAALMARRENFDGSDAQFARQWNINGSVFSRLKNTTSYEKLLRDTQWLDMARELDVTPEKRKWNIARTDVFVMVEEDIKFCKEFSKSFVMVDDTDIGKSETAKYMAATLKNCFYLDCRHSPSRNELIRALATAIGVDTNDKYYKIRANIRFVLKTLPNPIVIFDEGGALSDEAVAFVLEMWNGTEDSCGWYMLGADGLRVKWERNIYNKKVGWAELFSRFNARYNSIVPKERNERTAFYKKLISDVLQVNVNDKSKIPEIVRKCIANDGGNIAGLRRAKTLVQLMDS